MPEYQGEYEDNTAARAWRLKVKQKPLEEKKKGMAKIREAALLKLNKGVDPRKQDDKDLKEALKMLKDEKERKEKEKRIERNERNEREERNHLLLLKKREAEERKKEELRNKRQDRMS